MSKSKSQKMVMIWLALACWALIGIGGCSGPVAEKEDEKVAGAADLALVPGDALALVSVRVADLWTSDVGKETQKVLNTFGNPLPQLEKEVGLALADIERITLVMPTEEPELAWAIVASSKAVDRDQIVKGLRPETIEGQPVYEKQKVKFHFVSDKIAVVGGPKGVARFLSTSKSKTSGIMRQLAQQAEKGRHHLFAAVHPSAQIVNKVKSTPGADMFAPLLELESATLAVDLGSEIKLDLRAKFPDEEKAKNARQTIDGLLAMAKLAWPGLKKQASQPGLAPFSTQALSKYLDKVDETLNSLKLEQDGAELRLPVTVKVSVSEIMAALMVPSVQKVRAAAARTKSSNNLRQIGLAFHNYNDAMQKLPTASIGKGLSWRVALLPYLEEGELYKEFHLDEPWDSAHNMKLLPRMPKTYQHPSAPPSQTMTYYQVFTGPHTPFNGNTPAKIPATFLDGTSNTILVVEASKPVPWTKPDDIPYDPQKPLPKLGLGAPEGFTVCMADGTPRLVSPKVSEKTLRAAITPAAGDVLGPDW
jgi:hypothetical protein